MPYELLEDEAPTTKGRFELVEEGPSRARSLVSAPIKGAVRGAVDLAALSDPTSAIINLISGGKFGGKELTPHQRQAIERILPTQELPIEKGLERVGRLGVSAIGGPESLLARGVRVAAGATLGQLAEETGAPEWAQNLAELLGFVSPKFGKKLLPKPSQTEAVEFLRGKGLTDQEITPLLKSERKIRSLARLSEKGPKTEKVVKSISEKLGEGYEFLKTEGTEKFLKGNEVIAFDDKLSNVLSKIRPRFSRLIEKDVEALRNKGISQKNLIDFYQDVNDIVGQEKGGKSILNALKMPVLEGLEKIDPHAAQEFKKLNEFYAKKAVLAKGLKPDLFDKFLSKGKIYGLAGAIATGNLGFLKGILGKEVTTRIFREMLINPRLQNLSNQMLESISNNRFPSTLKILEIFKKELGKTDPEVSLDFVEEPTNNRE